MNRLAWPLLASSLLAVSSPAQVAPAADISVQYSPLYILQGYTIWNNGVSASAARNVNDWLGFVGDFGVYRGHVPEPLTGETYMLGPRFSYRKFDKLIPFAQDLFFQGLFGGSHFSQSTGGITGGGSQFTFALGGGADLGLGRAQKFALRPQLEYVGIRSAGSTTPAVRLSIGIAYHIGQH
jgi:hypothetical protein